MEERIGTEELNKNMFNTTFVIDAATFIDQPAHMIGNTFSFLTSVYMNTCGKVHILSKDLGKDKVMEFVEKNRINTNPFFMPEQVLDNDRTSVELVDMIYNGSNQFHMIYLTDDWHTAEELVGSRNFEDFNVIALTSDRVPIEDVSRRYTILDPSFPDFNLPRIFDVLYDPMFWEKMKNRIVTKGRDDDDLSKGDWTNINFPNYSAIPVKNLWTKWAKERGVSMPSITPREETFEEVRRLFLKASIEDFERRLSLSMVDYLNEYSELPSWCYPFNLRINESILTKYRDKKLIGYIIPPENDPGWIYQEKITNTFKHGGYVLTPELLEFSSQYEKLFKGDIVMVEKEKIQSRNLQIIIFRFMDINTNTKKFISIRWSKKEEEKKIVRIESVNSEGEWKIIDELSLKLDENSKKLDITILSLF